MSSLHSTPRFVQSRPERESSWNSTGVTAKVFYLFLHLLLNHLLLAFFLAFCLVLNLALLLAVQQETFPSTESPPDIGQVSCTPPSSTNLQYFLPLHIVYFVKYDVTVSFLAQVLDTVTYFVSQVLDTAS